MALALVSEDRSEWLRCRGWILPMVLESDLYDMAYIEHRLKNGSLQFWSSRNSVALTEILEFPKAKMLNVFAVAGATGFALRELFREIEPQLCEFGRQRRCLKIMGYGITPQWQGVCENNGYDHQWTVMAKRL